MFLVFSSREVVDICQALKKCPSRHFLNVQQVGDTYQTLKTCQNGHSFNVLDAGQMLNIEPMPRWVHFQCSAAGEVVERWIRLRTDGPFHLAFQKGDGVVGRLLHLTFRAREDGGGWRRKQPPSVSYFEWVRNGGLYFLTQQGEQHPLQIVSCGDLCIQQMARMCLEIIDLTCTDLFGYRYRSHCHITNYDNH